MARGAVKDGAATLQVEMVCLDELVPADDRYRRLDELVDWSFVREAAAPYYAEDVGRPSIDPIVLVKLMVASALEGIGSVRELLRVAALRLDLRRFLGYGFGERLPAHQTLSHAQTRRFVDGRLFERLFLRSLALCRGHDLLDGTHLSLDGFHSEANAALSSLRASLALAAAEDGETDARGAEEPSASPPSDRSCRWSSRARGRLRSATARTRPRSRLPTRTPSCAASRARARTSSTAARWRSIPGHAASSPAWASRPTATRATRPARPSTARASPARAGLGRRRSGLRRRARLDGLERRGIEAFVSPQRTRLPPHGEPKTDAQRQAQLARERCKTERGVWAHKRRMADAEGVIGELKNQGNLDRARCRGTPLFHVQLLIGCTAINLKRLAAQAGEAASGWAAGPASGELTALADATAVADGSPIAAARPSPHQSHSARASTATWSLSVSLN